MAGFALLKIFEGVHAILTDAEANDELGVAQGFSDEADVAGAIFYDENSHGLGDWKRIHAAGEAEAPRMPNPEVVDSCRDFEESTELTSRGTWYFLPDERQKLHDRHEARQAGRREPGCTGLTLR
jgi:hypothetical protein